MEWDIPLNKSSDIPLYRQLSNALMGLVESGKLKPNAKLPPIRQIAQKLGINNTTVVSAYKDLERKAAVYTITGSGTYVAPPIHTKAPQAQALPAFTDDYINFAHMATEAALFPVAAFKQAFNTVMDRDGAMAFGYHDTRGYKPLRESACHLLSGLGVKATPNNVHIVSSTGQGLRSLANALLTPGDIVFLEQPAPQWVAAVFQAGRAKIIEMPMLKDGPDFNALEALLKRHKPNIFYVTPNFHQPMGICYSTESKHRLLALARAYNAYIIEEDQLSDFYYDGIIRTPLMASDREGRVIYVKNFSRILTQGLGMGFVVCPDGMPEILYDTDTSPPGYTQRAFDVFLRSGNYESHTANMRRVYGRRYQRVVAAMSTYFNNLADFTLPGGGLSIWVTPHVAGDYVSRFLQKKVVVSPGELFAEDMPGFRLSFAAVPERHIAEGIGAIASTLQEGLR